MRNLRFFIIFALSFLLTSNTLHASEYIAFSLKVAQEKITKAPKAKDSPEVFYLGGITAVRGLVYDRKTGDAIIVGESDPERAPLTLDDFVVALKARFIHGKWPLVSIDPTPETKKTEMQIVRFEGGIEDTQFGEDLFDADYRLKQIGMGLLPHQVPGLKTYWDLGMERPKEAERRSQNIGSRFWFYPVLPGVSVREDVVSIKGLKIGVFTEVLSAEIDGKKLEDLSTFQDADGEEFAKQMSDRFDALADVHPSFLRLQGLDELVALSKAIEEMDERPDLSFWLKDYKIKEVKTKRELKVLRRKEEHKLQKTGMVYTGYQEVSGGVELMAIALRLKAGDVTALKEAVLKTRPKPDALSWGFLIGEWLIPTSPEMLGVEDVALLFVQANFLYKKKNYDDAIALLEEIIGIQPDLDFAYNNRGVAYAEKGKYGQAISDFTKALELNPMCAQAYAGRGSTYALQDMYELAISDYNKALKINPMLAEAYIGRGLAYSLQGIYHLAISDFNKALEIKPRLAEAYASKAIAYAKQGRIARAISEYNKAVEINPNLPKPDFVTTTPKRDGFKEFFRGLLGPSIFIGRLVGVGIATFLKPTHVGSLAFDRVLVAIENSWIQGSFIYRLGFVGGAIFWLWILGAFGVGIPKVGKAKAGQAKFEKLAKELERQRVKVKAKKSKAEAKLSLQRRKDEAQITTARKWLEKLRIENPEKATYFEKFLQEKEAKMALRATRRERRIKEKIEKELQKLQALETEVHKVDVKGNTQSVFNFGKDTGNKT